MLQMWIFPRTYYKTVEEYMQFSKEEIESAIQTLSDPYKHITFKPGKHNIPAVQTHSAEIVNAREIAVALMKKYLEQEN